MTRRLLLAGDPALVPSSDVATAVRFLVDAPSDDAASDAARTQILELIGGRSEAADRTTRPGHLTGSAFVVDATGTSVVLLFHAKLQRWLQPGGHADGDMNLAAVALREATEETGLDGLRVDPLPIDLDVHRVAPPKEDAHLHLDVRFLVIAPRGAVLEGNHESEDLRWVAWGELPRFDPDPGLVRLAAAARQRFDQVRETEEFA